MNNIIYIKFKKGKGVFHLSLCTGSNFVDRSGCNRVGPYGYLPPAYLNVTYCNGNWASNNEEFKNPPSGRLCPKCKELFIRTYSEKDLFLLFL